MKSKLLIIVLVLGLILTGCGDATKEEKTETKELTELTFVLDWVPNTNHTGVYVANEKGYFEEEGLKVNIVQPPEGGAEVMVASNQAQFGVSYQDFLAPALVGENKMPIQAIAAIIQHNTSGILSRKGEGMDRPKGMEGKTYATWDLPVEKATIKSVMEKDGGDFSKLTLVPSTVTDEVSALKTKSVDALWVFYGWAGVNAELSGLETDYFDFAAFDSDLDFYTPVLISNNDYLKDHPEIAKKFLNAVKKGYEFSINNPEEAAKILVQASDGLDEKLVIASQKWLADKYIADAKRWGEFDNTRWNNFYNWLNRNGLVEEEIPENTGFTNEYLPQ